MDQHRETELKWELSPADHDRLAMLLARELGAAHRLDQHNRFFDAADGRLRRHGLSLRLRLENQRLVITCKRRVGDGEAGGVHDHDEWEEILDPALWALADVAGASRLAARLPLPEPIRLALGAAPLVLVGGFANRRDEFHHHDELLCLDRTDFNGQRLDHELEIETPRPVETAAYWQQRLAGWGIAHRPQPLTKFARLLALPSPRPPAG